MKRLPLILLLLALLAFAQNQHELNMAADADYKKADAELNQVYKQLMARLDDASKKRLVDAQLLWIKFRDADAYARAEVNKGGSIYPMIFSGACAATTRARTAQLKEWYNEIKDL